MNRALVLALVLVAAAITSVFLFKENTASQPLSGDGTASIADQNEGSHPLAHSPDAGRHSSREMAEDDSATSGGVLRLPDEVDREPEPWKAHRLQELEDRWAAVQRDVQGGVLDPFNSVSFLVQISCRPLCDELGLAIPVPQGVEVPFENVPGTHFLSTGNTHYRIPEGMFPAVDDFMAKWKATEELAERNRAEARVAGIRPPPPRPFFPADPSFLVELEALKDEATRALLRRKDAY
ncbi:MAG: hypothetical protein H6828_00535 [Planctomycetes bacterium]|nr:hypothetical protein [Planctomycetota bacterium]